MAGRWAVMFQKLQDTEFVRTYNDRWTIEIDNDLEEDLTSSQRQDGWKIYQSSAFGSFECSDCGHLWKSARVSLTFHYRHCKDSSNGEVRLRLYRQKCRDCDNEDLLTAEFENDKIKMVLMRLVDRIKKNCYHQRIKMKHHFKRQKMTNPHESSLCEACMKGKCDREFDYS
ncbi:receptor-transporting protein 3-like [Discoglossus pictus]